MPNSLGMNFLTVEEAMAPLMRLSWAWDVSREKRPSAEMMIEMLWSWRRWVMLGMSL